MRELTIDLFAVVHCSFVAVGRLVNGRILAAAGVSRWLASFLRPPLRLSAWLGLTTAQASSALSSFPSALGFVILIPEEISRRRA